MHSLVIVDVAVFELNVAIFDVYPRALGRAPQVLALRHVPQEDVESKAEMEGSTHVLHTNTTSASECPCPTERAKHYQYIISKRAAIEGSTHGLQTNSTSTSEHPCATEQANQQAGLNGRQHSRPAHKHHRRK